MNIVVLAGGISTERDVSLVSGKMIYKSLKKNGHYAVLIDVFLGYNGDDIERIFESDTDWEGQIADIKEKNPDLNEVKKLRRDWKKNFFGPNVIAICQAADVVFMALHGENGENGKIQATFDLCGITYTGTDYVSSALSMNKSISKDIFKSHNIKTPWGIHIRKGEEDPHTVSFPCIVKACSGGSSVGVTIAEVPEQYESAKAEAYKYDDEAIVEEYIKGREFSIGVLDGKALPIIEIEPISGFYDYKNKYQAGSTIDTCPAKLSDEKTLEMQTIAEKVFKALRLRNYARIDFIMATDGTIYCLEANTLPGMTPVSLLPQEAAAIGISFDELCEQLIQISLRDKKEL